MPSMPVVRRCAFRSRRSPPMSRRGCNSFKPHSRSALILATSRTRWTRPTSKASSSVRIGKQLADFLVVAIHCHQNSFAFQAYSQDHQTPNFLIELAHQVIDNGADVFVGHGVHTLRGIEIYKGKPIF